MNDQDRMSLFEVYVQRIQHSESIFIGYIVICATIPAYLATLLFGDSIKARDALLSHQTEYLLVLSFAFIWLHYMTLRMQQIICTMVRILADLAEALGIEERFKYFKKSFNRNLAFAILTNPAIVFYMISLVITAGLGGSCPPIAVSASISILYHFGSTYYFIAKITHQEVDRKEQ